jgi:hypothetical protein
MAKKFCVTKKTANTSLRMEGVNKTEPMCVDNRFVEDSMEAQCGMFCKECQQHKEGLCQGCYVGCTSDVKTCTTIDCDKNAQVKIKQKDGTIETITGACLIRCCKHSRLGDWIQDVSDGTGSLAIKDVKWEPFASADMGGFIPSVERAIDGAYVPYVSVSLNVVYNANNDRIVAPGKSIYETLQLHPKTKVILNAYCLDPCIETFWTTFRRKEHFKALVDKGIKYGMGFNYSVYYGHPRMEHLINMRRNFGIISDMQKAGMFVIPDLCWFDDLDIKQFVDWMNDNQVSVVSTSLQLARDNSIMARNMFDLDYMQAHCPTVKRWIINGPSTPYRIRLLADRYRDIVIMNKHIQQLSKYRMIWDYKCNAYVKAINEKGELIPKKQAFETNCKFYEDLVFGKNLDKFDPAYLKKEQD